MSNQEAIEQLECLKIHCESMVTDGCAEWEKDVQALDIAINTIQNLK